MHRKKQIIKNREFKLKNKNLFESGGILNGIKGPITVKTRSGRLILKMMTGETSKKKIRGKRNKK